MCLAWMRLAIVVWGEASQTERVVREGEVGEVPIGQVVGRPLRGSRIIPSMSSQVIGTGIKVRC